MCVDDRALAEMKIIDRLIPRCSSPSVAWRLYRTERIPGFGGLTAQQLVDAERGADVLEYIDAVDLGAFA